MREGTFNGGTIKYPDEIAFAFNPIIIQLKNSKKGDVTIDITDESGSLSYSDTRSYYGDTFEADISGYLKLFFNRPEYNTSGEQLISTSRKILIDVKENSTLFSFEFTCIWGVIEPGDVFNGARTVRWFKYLPQTISVFIPSGTELQYRYGKSSYTKYGKDKVNEINHIMIISLIPSSATNGAFRIVGDEGRSVWAYTFDNTFAADPRFETIIKLKIDECKDGFFLRWVDRFGFYQYWLFKPADWGYDSNSDGEIISSKHLIVNRHYEYSRYQGRINERTIRMGVSLLEKEEAEMVVGIIQSPLVSLLKDNKWIPVNVSDGSIKLTSEHLQDIEITVELPELKTQRL